MYCVFHHISCFCNSDILVYLSLMILTAGIKKINPTVFCILHHLPFHPFWKWKNRFISLKIKYTSWKQTFFMWKLYLAVGRGLKINFNYLSLSYFLCSALEVGNSCLWMYVSYPQLGSMPAAGGFGVQGICFVCLGFFPRTATFLLCFPFSCTQGRQLPAEVEIAPMSSWKTRRLVVGMCFFRCLSSLDEEALHWYIKLKVRLLQLHFQDLSPSLGCYTHPLWVFLSLI